MYANLTYIEKGSSVSISVLIKWRGYHNSFWIEHNWKWYLSETPAAGSDVLLSEKNDESYLLEVQIPDLLQIYEEHNMFHSPLQCVPSSVNKVRDL